MSSNALSGKGQLHIHFARYLYGFGGGWGSIVRFPFFDVIMMCRMDDVHLDAIQSIPIIPFILGLVLRHLIEISVSELRVVYGVTLATPHANLHLVVSVVCRRVDEQSLACALFHRNIAFPQVPVGQDRFDGASVGLQGAQEAGNHLQQSPRGDFFVMRPRSVMLQVLLECALQQFGVERCPAAVP